MITFPSELEQTLNLIYYANPKESYWAYEWPYINEDVIGERAENWKNIGAFLAPLADQPTRVTNTIWRPDPDTSWTRGADRPLDSFVSFWKNYPTMHYGLAASNASAVAGALSGYAGNVIAYKTAFLGIVAAVRYELSAPWHLLGPTHYSSWLGSSGGMEAVNLSNLPTDSPYTVADLQAIAPHETTGPNGRIAEDLQALLKGGANLRQLAATTQQQMAPHLKILGAAAGVMNDVGLFAQRVSNDLAAAAT